MKCRTLVSAAALALALALSLPSAAADAPTLADRHVQAGVQCSGCHRENPPAKKVKTAQCQTCHGDYAKLKERTKAMKPNNVHDNHLGDLDCRECHQGHKPDRLACSECHKFQFSMPAKK